MKTSFKIDAVFLCAVIMLTLMGTLAVYTAGYHFAEVRYGDPLYFIKRQCIWVLLGICSAVAGFKLKTDIIKRASPFVYIITLLMLVLTLLIGFTGNGAQRWISIGPITVQPSEIAKLAIPMMLAFYYDAHKEKCILSDSKKKTPDVLLLASGSEVEMMVKAQEKLWEEDIDARVVSMPCMEEFEKQSEKYKQSVIPSKVRARVAAEAGSAMSWYKYVGLDGELIAMDDFGASAPAEYLFEKYGFTVENVIAKVHKVLGK